MTQIVTRRRSIRRPNHFSGAAVASDTVYPVPHTPRSHHPKALTGNGDFCYFMDRSGRQHFNFVQRIWLDPAISMEFTTVQTTALETLAVNLLTLVTRERDCRTAVGITSQRALALKLRKPHSYVYKSEIGDRRIDPLEFIAWCRACKRAPTRSLSEIERR